MDWSFGKVATAVVAVVVSWWFSRVVDRWQQERERANNERLEIEKLKLAALHRIEDALRENPSNRTGNGPTRGP